jgi:hypothetical protein
VPSLATDLACALDPVVFSRMAGIDPDPWQARVLRSAAPRLLLNCSRQSGKSTTSATLAMHTAIYQAPALVLMLSPGLRQSGEIFRKCLDVYKALDRPVPAEAETALTLELDNGSRIVALPGTEATIRGYSGAKLLIVDEASRVEDSLYYSVRPMMAVSSGRLALLSTPHGQRGFFYDEWQQRAVWDWFEIPADMCPRISKEFLEQERKSLPLPWFNQEYRCIFGDLTDTLFPLDLVRSAARTGIGPLFPEGFMS